MNNFVKRLITCLILAPITLYLVYIGELALLLFIILICIIASFELTTIILEKNKNFKFLSVTCSALLPIAAFYDISIFFNLAFFYISIWVIRLLYKKILFINFWSSYFFVIIYSSIGISFSIIIRNLENGFFLLLIPIILSSVNDITAYIIGKNFGNKKAFPTVSPNKTFEGSFAGVIGTIIVSYFLFNYFDLDIGISKSISIGLIVAVMGILGDLLESVIKRKSGIKDSGSILPGHGGILDRIDSLILILPIFYLIIILFDVNN